MKKKTYYFEINNSYGCLRAVDFGDGRCQLELDDFSSTSVQEISIELLDLMKKEMKRILP
jgi:hypothetical protein